jgi:hypothetical protein
MSFDNILEEYPSLTIEDIRAAIDYGSEMSRERFALLPWTLIFPILLAFRLQNQPVLPFYDQERE